MLCVLEKKVVLEEFTQVRCRGLGKGEAWVVLRQEHSP